MSSLMPITFRQQCDAKCMSEKAEPAPMSAKDTVAVARRFGSSTSISSQSRAAAGRRSRTSPFIAAHTISCRRRTILAQSMFDASSSNGARQIPWCASDIRS